MEKIKIVTDSTCDLPVDVTEKYSVEVLPLLVTVGDKSYMDGVDIRLPELLNIMESMEELPGTSQVNPIRLIECYKKYIEEGYKIVSIHMSSKMSGTYQSACIAKEMLDTNDIVVVDSLNVTAGLGVLVMEACKLRDAGCGIEEIEAHILRTIPHVKSALSFECLDNLVKGGRLSKTAAVIGNILGIRPILCVKDGEMAVMDKVRGSKKAIRNILDYIEKHGIKGGTASILLRVDNIDVRDALFDELSKRNVEFIESEVGCVVGVHSGPHACGVFFIEEF